VTRSTGQGKSGKAGHGWRTTGEPVNLQEGPRKLSDGKDRAVGGRGHEALMSLRLEA